MNAQERLNLALAALEASQHAFRLAEQEAIKVLKAALKPAGKYGVSVAPLDGTDGDIYVPLAEHEPQQIFPITLIRFWNDKLEVFISDYVPHGGDDGWTLLPEGQWIPYEDAHTDTWFMIDCVRDNIEYADGYQDE